MSDRFVVDADSPPYVSIPVPVLKAFTDRHISANAVVLYAVLDSYRNRKTKECWPGLRGLSVDSGFSITTIRKLLEDLKREKFLTITASNSFRHPQVYKLLCAPSWKLPSVAETGTVPAVQCDSSRTSSRTSSCTSLSNTQPLDLSDPREPRGELRPATPTAPPAASAPAPEPPKVPKPVPRAVGPEPVRLEGETDAALAGRQAAWLMRRTEETIRNSTGVENAVTWARDIAITRKLIVAHGMEKTSSILADDVQWRIEHGCTWTGPGFAGRFTQHKQWTALRAEEGAHERRKQDEGVHANAYSRAAVPPLPPRPPRKMPPEYLAWERFAKAEGRNPRTADELSAWVKEHPYESKGEQK